ncbi:MAG: hypothetical protein HYZ71_12775 [Deltaproteobacteria bacterium]|nr:hypothetical protein [Deltaproteobacteria bacterium]
MTEPGINLRVVSWLDEKTKNLIKQVAPHRQLLMETVEKESEKMQSVWDKYIKLRKLYAEEGHKVIGGERAYFDEYQKFLRPSGDNPCASFEL